VNLPREQRLMRSSGVWSVRVAVQWAQLQPRAGARPNLRSLDRFVAGAARARLDVLPVVLGTPGWAAANPSSAASPPRDPRTYGRFLQALVRRYGPRGSLWRGRGAPPRRPSRRWQIWNEPDITKYWSAPGPWQRGYVRLLRAARTALKRADPRAQVVLAGLTNRSWLDLRKVYAAGGRGLFDLAAAHPFSARVSNVVKIVRLVRAEMRRARDARTPLLVTELSWTSGKGRATFTYGWETTESGQASRVRSALRRLAAARGRFRLAGVYWYTWLSPRIGGRDSFSYSGLRRLNAAGRPVSKPALAAFRGVARALAR
jgi:polysaccharide biosynthesis protein PslG